jgi:predicted short-subunit dehydrogenase-like oxidoreductase (DUF2520 family)
MLRFAVVGPGRAGRSFRGALEQRGATCAALLGRHDDPADLDASLDLVIIAVPDRVIANVAEQIPIGPLVVHLSGATGLDVLLHRHARCGSVHPLISLSDPTMGAQALSSGANLAIAAPTAELLAEVRAVTDLLEARTFVVDDAQRTSYHATAAISANHLVALCAQIERLTERDQLPIGPFLDMMRAVLDNVETQGTTASLTGPVARGDWEIVRAHLDAIGDRERSLYLALAAACAELANRTLPPDLLEARL